MPHLPPIRACLLPVAGWLALALLPPLPAPAGDGLPRETARKLQTAFLERDDGLYAQAESNCRDVLLADDATERERRVAFSCLCDVYALSSRPDAILDLLDGDPELASHLPPPLGAEGRRVSALCDLGRAAEALELVEKAEAEAEGDAEVAFLQLHARVLLALDDTASAVNLFRKIDADPSIPPEIRAENLLAWARALAAAGVREDAVAMLASQADTGVTNAASAEGVLLRARLLAESTNRADAATAEALLAELAASPWASPWHRALAYVGQADLAIAPPARPADAAAFASNAVAAAAQDPGGWRVALLAGGVLAKDRSTLPQAVALLDPAIAANPAAPESAAAVLALAAAYDRFGEVDAAVREYDLYLDSFHDEEGCRKARLGRAWALFHAGRYDAAAAAFHLAAGTVPDVSDRVSAFFQEGDSLFRAGQFLEAADVFARIAAEYPDSGLAPTSRLCAGVSFERAGQTGDAEAAYRALDGSPLAAESLLRLGTLQERAHDDSAAADTYTRALEAVGKDDPLRGRPLLGRGRACCALYEFARAAADLRAAAKDPGCAREAGFWLIRAYYGQGQDENALAACHAFLDAPPAKSSPAPGGASGTAAGPPPPAALASPLAMDDGALRANATLWLAKYCYNHFDFDGAKLHFLEVPDQWPSNPWADVALVWAGRAASRAADYAEAVEILSGLPARYPESTHLDEARFVQANALGELARFEDAVFLLDEIIDRFPDGDWAVQAYGRKGDFLFSLGSENPARYDEAVSAYLKAARHPGASPAVRLQAEFKIGRCLEKAQKTDAAIQQYFEKVFLPFLDDTARGISHDEAAQGWFVKSAFLASDLLIAQGNRMAARNILEKMARSGLSGEPELPGKAEARARLDRLHSSGILPPGAKEPAQ